MATQKSSSLISSTSVKGSDFVSDFPCDPCMKEGRAVESINFCQNCNEYYCQPCTKQHSKFGVTAGHKVQNRTQGQRSNGSTASGDQASGVGVSNQRIGMAVAAKGANTNIDDVCMAHAGKRITSYCADHDVVICGSCVSDNHRSCAGVSSIQRVSGGSKHSKDIDKVKIEILECLRTLGKTDESLKGFLSSTEDVKNNQHHVIHEYTQRLIDHALEMEKTAIEVVHWRFEKVSYIVEAEKRSLNDTTASLKFRLKSLDNCKVNNDCQAFVDIRRGKEEVKNAKSLIDTLDHVANRHAVPAFDVADEIEEFLNDVHSLGVSAKANYEAALHGEFDISVSGHAYECSIIGSCELSDDTILVTDYGNLCLKKLDKSYKISDCLDMGSGPWGICRTREDEVAVTLSLERVVQFVNVRGGLKMTRRFEAENRCRGICYSRGELFISCGGHPGDEDSSPEGPGFVAVYDIFGSPLRKLEIDSEGFQVASFPCHIAASESGDRLHIADGDMGVVIIDRQGQVLSLFSNDRVQSTRGICALDGDEILTCGLHSINIVEVDFEGRMCGYLLTEDDGINSPMSVLYTRASSRLVVTQVDSNSILVFDLYIESPTA